MLEAVLARGSIRGKDLCCQLTQRPYLLIVGIVEAVRFVLGNLASRCRSTVINHMQDICIHYGEPKHMHAPVQHVIGYRFVRMLCVKSSSGAAPHCMWRARSVGKQEMGRHIGASQLGTP